MTDYECSSKWLWHWLHFWRKTSHSLPCDFLRSCLMSAWSTFEIRSLCFEHSRNLHWLYYFGGIWWNLEVPKVDPWLTWQHANLFAFDQAVRQPSAVAASWVALWVRRPHRLFLETNLPWWVLTGAVGLPVGGADYLILAVGVACLGCVFEPVLAPKSSFDRCYSTTIIARASRKITRLGCLCPCALHLADSLQQLSIAAVFSNLTNLVIALTEQLSGLVQCCGIQAWQISRDLRHCFILNARQPQAPTASRSSFALNLAPPSRASG